jgi:tetratricopeptide (TPR) repeat protein
MGHTRGNSKQTLGLCMIVKDEEELIAQCLTSVKDFVEEIIVVDTGCQDRTVEIAEALGAKVFMHPWTGDFSVARNQSIDHMTMDWIIILDADERLASRDAAQLPALIANSTCQGFKLIQRNYLWDARVACSRPTPPGYEEGRKYSNCVDLPVIRLFRNIPEIRFQGRVHELVDPVFEAKQLPYQYTNLVIHHYGKVGDRDRLETKKRIYLDLGAQKAEEEPANAMAQYEMGIQLFELNRYAESIPYFEEADRLNPKFDFARFYLALAYHRLGRLQEAGPYYEQCLATNQQNDRVLLDYANYLRDLGRLKKAIRSYRKCITLNPRNALAFFNMGSVYISLGRTNEGFECLTRALSLNPDSEVLYENFARLAMERGHLNEAIPVLRRGAEKFPLNRNILGLLAETYFKLQQFDQVRDWAKKGISLDPNWKSVWLIKAHSEFSTGCFSDANTSYRRVLERDPGNLDCLMNLALLAERGGDSIQMEMWLSEVLARYPDQAFALKKLATMQARKSPDESALNLMERAFRANPTDTECLLLLGYLYEKSGRLESAIELYEKAQTENPKLARLAGRKIQRLIRSLGIIAQGDAGGRPASPTNGHCLQKS